MSRSPYEATHLKLRTWFGALVGRVPPAQKCPFKDSFVYRYVERTPQQAIVQKLARVITTLQCAEILFRLGRFQEQGMMHRVLDEFHDDILFLSLAIVRKDWTARHDAFLDAFNQEERDDEGNFNKTRPMIPRDKIRAFNAKHLGDDPSTVSDSKRVIDRMYSGFVHAAAPQVMDMYGGYPPRFHLDGMSGTPRESEFAHELWTYFYRSIVAFGAAADSLDEKSTAQQIVEWEKEFQRVTGRGH